MNRQVFLQLLDEEHKKIVTLNKTKGHDYAGDEDALSNFKLAAQRIGITPEQVWFVYCDKHYSAVATYVKEGQVESEPIEGRILDCILYLYLLLGLVREKAEYKEIVPGGGSFTLTGGPHPDLRNPKA